MQRTLLSKEQRCLHTMLAKELATVRTFFITDHCIRPDIGKAILQRNTLKEMHLPILLLTFIIIIFYYF